MLYQAFQIWEVQWKTEEKYYWLKTTEVCLVHLKLEGLEFAKSIPCEMLFCDCMFGLKFAIIF